MFVLIISKSARNNNKIWQKGLLSRDQADLRFDILTSHVLIIFCVNRMKSSWFWCIFDLSVSMLCFLIFRFFSWFAKISKKIKKQKFRKNRFKIVKKRRISHVWWISFVFAPSRKPSSLEPWRSWSLQT